MQTRPTQRVTAIDRMRGLVMVFMVIDHADLLFNRDHQFHDSARFYDGAAFPAWDFLTRWLTHLCAPTFVFLAGVAIAFSVAGQRARGVPDGTIDRHLIGRGLFIALLDPLLVSTIGLLSFFRGQIIVLQVLYAIGVSMALMALLRRLPPWLVALGSVALLVLTEVVFMAQLAVFRAGALPPGWLGATVTAGTYPIGSVRIAILYPLLPWLAIMALGWVVGGWAMRVERHRLARGLFAGGLASLLGFAALRWANGWGNAGLLRTDGSPLQWLHVSKYPPSLTYVLLELGLMAVILSGMVWLEQRRPPATSPGRAALLPLFGRTALFFYVLHLPLLQVMQRVTWYVTSSPASSTGALEPGAAAFGLGASYIVTATVLLFLYPLCIAYDRYKRVHPDGWTRFL
jgi:uncharacterized membrane protein